MLQFIRNRAQGVLAWVIVIIIIIPFALWGIQEYLGGGPEVGVATVNDTNISSREFQQAYQLQRERMKEVLGDSFDEGSMAAQLKDDVLRGLIENELLLQSALDSGLRVSDQQLAHLIQTNEAFQSEGKFSKTQYAEQLRRQGDAPASFETRLRRFMLANQVYSGVSATAMVSDWELDNILRLRKQQRDVSYLTLRGEDFKPSVQVAEEKIERYYRQNEAQYTTSERVTIEYVELSTDSFLEQFEADEQIMKALYEEQRDMFLVPEERRASHILLQVADDASDDEREQARTQAEGLVQRIKDGESFASLAKEYSDDPGSAELGGDLGYFRRGIMDPAFDEAVFGLQAGEVSAVVETSFGLHIIKLDDIRAPRGRSYDEVRDVLAEQYKKGRSEREYFNKKEALINLAYENPQTLSIAAQELGLTIKQSEPFTRSGGSGLTAEKAVIEAAFSDEVLNQNFNSELIEINEVRAVVLRLKEHERGSVRPLAEVRDDIEQLLIKRAAEDKAAERGAQLLKELRDGAAHEQIGDQHGASWQSAGLITRESTALDAAIVNAAFRIPRPAQGQPGYEGVRLASGDYALILVSAIEDGDPAQVNEAERKALRNNLQAISGNTAYDSYVDTLRRAAEITVNQKNL